MLNKLVEIEHGCGDLIVPRLDGDNWVVHRAVPCVSSPAVLDLLDGAPVTAGAMICAPEKTTLRRESSREVSGRSAYFLEPDGGCVEVFSHRRRKLVEAQLFHEPSVCELLAGELAELAIKLIVARPEPCSPTPADPSRERRRFKFSCKPRADSELGFRRAPANRQLEQQHGRAAGARHEQVSGAAVAVRDARRQVPRHRRDLGATAAECSKSARDGPVWLGKVAGPVAPVGHGHGPIVTLGPEDKFTARRCSSHWVLGLSNCQPASASLPVSDSEWQGRRYFLIIYLDIVTDIV